MSDHPTFDHLSFGTHFQDDQKRKFVKVNTNMTYNGQLPLFFDKYHEARFFNAVDYNGIPVFIPFELKVEVIRLSNEDWLVKQAHIAIENGTLDNPETSDIISSRLNDSLNTNKVNTETNMRNTNAVNTAPKLTLSEAVVNAVNELKVKGSFSAYDVTTAIRAAANAGEIALPGLEARGNQSGISYWVNHEDVKREIDALLNNGELANLGLTNVNYNGSFRVFEFATSATATSAPTATSATSTSDTDPADSDSPLATRVEAYLSKVGSATLKQVQSALKVNGVTCKDFADIVKNLGYSLTAGTDGCYSTYTVS
jgi:hypothetical protein